MKNLYKILVFVLTGFSFTSMLADDSVWRLETVDDKAKLELYADNKLKVGTNAAQLIPFSDIVYGMKNENNYNSWFVGGLESVDDNVQMVSYVTEYAGEKFIPIDDKPVEISRGLENNYYSEFYENPQPAEFTTTKPRQASLNPVRKNEYTTAYEPITRQVTMPDNSAYGNEPRFSNKSIKYYPFR